jgi:hypothetical protein
VHSGLGAEQQKQNRDQKDEISTTKKVMEAMEEKEMFKDKTTSKTDQRNSRERTFKI